jgi:hypothetical protein
MIFAQPFFYYWLASSLALALIASSWLWKPAHMSASVLERRMCSASGELRSPRRKHERREKVTFRAATFLLRSLPSTAFVYWTRVKPYHSRQRRHAAQESEQIIEAI